MRKITSIHELVDAIQRKDDIFQLVDGRTYEASFILLLNTKLIDLITGINEGKYFYRSDH